MTYDVIIKNVDETYIKVDCDYGITQELYDKFRFRAEGFQFSPKYKKGYWDGYINLFSISTRKIYRGLADEVIKYCEKNGYSYQYEGYSFDTEMTREKVIEFAQSLNLDITPHYFQIDALIHALTMRRSLVLSPTGSGKSLIIYVMIRYMIDVLGYKGMLVVPKVSLVEQMYTDMKDYAKLTNWDIESTCQRIYEGQDKIYNKPLTITTWQSVYTQKPPFFASYDFIIVDETHQCKAKSLIHIVSSMVNAKYRLGLTGTLDGKLMNQLTIQGLFGSIKQVATTAKLMEEGYLAKFKIKALLLKYDPIECEYVKSLKYQAEIDYLTQHPRRNGFIANLALSTDNNTLVLFSRIEHGKQLVKTIRKQLEKNGDERNVYLIYGAVDVDVREEIRKKFEDEKNAIIVASSGVFSVGVNIKNLYNIIFAHPSKARIRTLQSIGRGLRLHEGKTTTLFDIADDMRYKKYINTTLTHFDERIKIYNSENFEFKVLKINMF